MKGSHPTSLTQFITNMSDTHWTISTFTLCILRQTGFCLLYISRRQPHEAFTDFRGASLIPFCISSHISSPLYSTNACHIYSSYICIPLHIKKRSHIQTPSFIHVCSYPVLIFSKAPSGKGYLGGYLIKRTHEFGLSKISVISFVYTWWKG